MTAVDRLLSELTLEEKLALTAGADMWHTVAVERLGIGRIKVTDGPSGARGERFTGGRSASFPCGTAIAATWNPALVRDVGTALAAEAKRKGAHVLLGPTVNIHRHPLAGRNFECYSEDPHLAASIAAAYVEGLQSAGVGACVKHLVCNDQEHERHSVSAEVDERALREVYLLPFEAAIRGAGAWSTMAAYNRLDGTHCTEHPGLLRDILRDDWGFDGVVISDWWATKSGPASLAAGLDLEMPGPGAHMGTRLLDADVPEGAVDEAARRILRLAERTGALGAGAEPGEDSADDPEVRAVARRCAQEAIVLLRNERDALPLTGARTLAVVGPNADVARIQGGGSAQVNPHPTTTVLDALHERDADIVFERGCWNDRGIPPIDGRSLAGALEVTYLRDGHPVLTEGAPRGRFVWLGPPARGIEGPFGVRIRGTIAPFDAGDWTFALTNAGRATLAVDGDVVVDNSEPERGSSFFGLGSTEATGTARLEAGRRYELAVEYSSREGSPISGVLVGCRPPIPDDLLERAVDAARGADAAVVVVGSTEDWETEGRDRDTLRLPGPQDELVRRVAAANPRTIVVVNAGSPHEMPWADDVAAVVQAWYPGQEGGPAVADVLFGDVNPSGKLPATFPRTLADIPPIDYPGEGGRVAYAEGVFVGYRAYDRDGIEPRFPFGHGLSYTTFRYADLEVEAGDPARVSVDVTNAGDRPGAEVVQLYVGDPECRVPRPPRELKAFQKVSLDPGESRTVSFALDRRAFSFWEPGDGWTFEPGTFRIEVGSSSRDIRLGADLLIEG